MNKFRQAGKRLGAYIQASDPSTQQIQALLSDLLADDELREGGATVVTCGWESYRFQFHGPKLGFGGYLEVKRAADGSKMRFGPLWGSEAVSHALNHLSRGWGSRQFPAYRGLLQCPED
jgi:hypothetical protein